VIAYLEGLLDTMGLDAEMDAETADGVHYVNVWGAESPDDMAVLIGKRGHTLDSLQELVRGYVFQTEGERCRIVVDVEDYRKRRRSHLIRRANEVAGRVKRSGEAEALDPMNAFERKIVHDAVGRVGGLETASEGDEPNRRVVIRRTAR